LTKKALAKEQDERMEGRMLAVIADLYKCIGDLENLGAITKKRIDHIKRHPSDDAEKEIQRIQEEFDRYKKAGTN
jgi:hypothetical protein